MRRVAAGAARKATWGQRRAREVVAALGRHHSLELLEPDAPVAVHVDAGDHPLTESDALQSDFLTSFYSHRISAVDP